MAVAYAGSVPTVTPGTAGTFTTANWTISGSNLVIIVQVGLSGGTVSSVSWSLGSGTPVEVKNASNAGFASIWAIPAPTAGTGTITVNLSTSIAYQINADYFTGADQTTPCPTGDAVAATSDVTSSATLTPTNLTSSDATSGNDANTAGGDTTGVTPHQTFLNDSTAVNSQAGYNTGTTGVTFNYNTGGHQSRVAVRIVASASAATQPPYQPWYQRAPLLSM